MILKCQFKACCIIRGPMLKFLTSYRGQSKKVDEDALGISFLYFFVKKCPAEIWYGSAFVSIHGKTELPTPDYVTDVLCWFCSSFSR